MFEFAIIVRSKTRRELLEEKFQTHAQARFYLERAGGTINEIDAEHARYYASLESIQLQLQGRLKYKIIDRSFLPSFLFSEQHLVITVGQDGLVANAAKYVGGQPIIGVNPDPQVIDGILVRTNVHDVARQIDSLVLGQATLSEITMAELRLNDGQRLLAFNDFFIGPQSHTSARYAISHNGHREEHSSSGILVATGAGKTGWMSSVLNMVKGISGQAHLESFDQLQWNSRELLFAVREPFASRQSQASLVWGMVTPDQPLLVESKMATSGVVFSDGIERDFLHFNSGATATVGIASERARLVAGS